MPRKSPVRMCPRCKSKLWDTPRPRETRPESRKTGLGIDEIVGKHRDALRSLAAEFGASNLRVFGSVARGEAGPRSDLDLLVRFRRSPGLLGREEFRERAEALLGRKVDLTSDGGLHWYIRPKVLAEAVEL